ncbi:MAG TPA: hypothetical protein VJ976_00910 [Ornithinimicrobium sp.]|uniref:hypothetical protein n=1 Tax=Ornithinimicrobium sp. TaxID=1977084 RepID=UPI002B458D9B|nr:hypothetical protein [Ornithinimicrobium sp.]HKJ10926.1 hypothetical protein [Ornithinimicrobium sp.]
MAVPPNFDMRLPPSGPTFEGTADGQTFVWDQTLQKWNIALDPGNITEFDFIIRDRADLVDAVGTPVAGEFILVDGSYFWGDDVLLDPGETVAADAVTVFMMGGGPVGSLDRGFRGNGAASDPAFDIRNGANVRLLNMRIAGAAIAQHGVAVAGATLDADWCAFPTTAGGSQPGLLLGATSVGRISRTTIGGANEGVEITGGAKHLFRDCTITSGSAGNGLTANVGATVTRLQFDGCFFRGSASGSPPVVLETAPDLDVFFNGCEWESNAANTPCLLARGIGSLVVDGGFMSCSAAPVGDGLSLATDPMQGGVQVIGLHGHALDDLVVASVNFDCRRAVIMGCDTATDVTVGIDWQAPVPTNGGLLIVGNNFDTTTPLQGITAATANVNLKACSDRNGLMTETAIVP